MTTTEPMPAAEPRLPGRPVPLPVTGIVITVAAVALLAAIVGLLADSPPDFMDLDVYRLGVAAWWHRADMYGQLPPTIAHIRLPFIYPPFAVLFLGPLTALPWHVSTAAMLVLSIAALGVVIGLTVHTTWPDLHRRTTATVVAGVLALTMLFQPVWDTLGFGQVNLVLMCLVALDCLLERTPWPRGALVGIAAAVKLTPAVFLLYFLLRKDNRAAVTMAVTALAATAVGFVVSWQGSIEFWFGSGKGARTVSGSAYYQNQTVAAFLARLPLPAHLRSELWLAIAAVLLVVGVLAIRRARCWDQRALAMSLTGCLGLIVSPTSWGHHWVYVVPGVIAMAGQAVATRSRGWAVALVVTVATFVLAPFRWLSNDYAHWSWGQHVLDNAYIAVGVSLLAVFAFRSNRWPLRWRSPSDGSRDMRPTSVNPAASASASNRSIGQR